MAVRDVFKNKGFIYIFIKEIVNLIIHREIGKKY